MLTQIYLDRDLAAIFVGHVLNSSHGIPFRSALTPEFHATLGLIRSQGMRIQLTHKPAIELIPGLRMKTWAAGLILNTDPPMSDFAQSVKQQADIVKVI